MITASTSDISVTRTRNITTRAPSPQPEFDGDFDYHIHRDALTLRGRKPPLLDRLHRVNEQLEITLFVIEHNMGVIMNLAEYIYCLAHGELLAEGKPEQVQRNQKVLEAYLGAR